MKNAAYMRNVRKAFAFLIIGFVLAGCATNARAKAKPVLIEHPERFFWEIKGAKGSVFVLGTIHIADKTFYPLEENVLRTFDGADRLVSELGGLEDMQAIAKELQAVIPENMNTDPEKNLLRKL